VEIKVLLQVYWHDELSGKIHGEALVVDYFDISNEELAQQQIKKTLEKYRFKNIQYQKENILRQLGLNREGEFYFMADIADTEKSFNKSSSRREVKVIAQWVLKQEDQLFKLEKVCLPKKYKVLK